MKPNFILILSCIVFLAALFLFNLVVFALAISILFFLSASLLESWFPKQFNSLKNIFQTKLSVYFPNEETVKIFFLDSLGTVTISMAIFSLTYLPVEFLITEVWLITSPLNPNIGVLILISSIFIFSRVNFSNLFQKRRFLLASFFIIIAGFISYKEIRREKLNREYLPKIFGIVKPEGIQAEVVKIKGLNFFPEWKKGKVILGDQEMIIKAWNDKLIEAEQQVPSKIGLVELYIKRSDGIVSNKIPFKIIDPNELN